MGTKTVRLFFFLSLFSITLYSVFATEESMSVKRYGLFVGSNYGGDD